MKAEQIKKWRLVINTDHRVNIWHKGVLMAIIHLIEETGNNPVGTSRRIIMSLAKIKSIVTYHKYIKQLQELGYIDYNPSFHPAKGSLIFLK